MNRFSRLFLSTSKMVKPIKIGTHDGAFHCDEVFACVMLRMLPEFVKVCFQMSVAFPLPIVA